MRVSFIIQDLFSLGAQYVTALMVRGFTARGYQVDLIVSKVHQDLLAEGKKPFEVPAETNWVFLPDRKARKNIWALRRYLKTTDSVAVVAMSTNYTACLSMAAVGLRKRPEIYHVEHSSGVGCGWNGRGKAHPPGLISKVRLKNWFLYKRFKKLLTVSAGTADAMSVILPYPRQNIGVVYNPVIDEVFSRKVSEPAKHEWLKNKDCPTFIVAGAHSGFKNQMLAIKAVELANKQVRCRLIVFGRGPLTPEYEEYITEHHLERIISLPGFTDNLPAEIKASDGFICSSDIESFSVVLVEALGCGVPIVSTDCPYGPREVLDGGRYGILVPPRNVNAMAESIVKMARKEGHWIPPEESWKRFSLDRIVDLYERELGLTRFVYPFGSDGWKIYTRSANAYQKMALVTGPLGGRVIVEPSAREGMPEEFGGRWIDAASVRRDAIICRAPSNEKSFLRTWWKAIRGERQVLFCWDPPGVTRRDSKELLWKLRCWLLDVLQAMCIRRSVCTVMNLHPGFMDRRFSKKTQAMVRCFPNGTCVRHNRQIGVGERCRCRVVVNNAFWKEKNCYVVAKLLIGIKKRVPEMSIVWIGHGGETENVRKLLRDNGFAAEDIVHLGKSAHDETLRLIASASVALNAYPDVPSLRWNYVLKIPEFMSMGVPVVSVDLPGAREYVRDGKDGYLFGPGDDSAAVDVMVRLLQNENLRAEMSRSAYARAEEYDWRKINDQIAAWIREMTESVHSPTSTSNFNSLQQSKP